jgi:uncharacterized protein YbjT (DUF2867 family)
MPENFRVSWLSTTDLGSYVGAALRRPELAGQSFDVGGPDALDGPALAGALSSALGQPLSYVPISPDAFERGLVPQFGESVARGVAQTYRYCARFSDSACFTGTSVALGSSLSRPARSLAEWARQQKWQS